MLRASQLFFALVPKVELEAETIFLYSGPKFLCFLVHFLISVPNTNCVQKSLCGDLTSLRNHISLGSLPKQSSATSQALPPPTLSTPAPKPTLP